MKRFIFSIIIILMALSTLSGYSRIEAVAEPVEETQEPMVVDRLSYWEEHPDESPMLELTEIRYLATVADAVVDNGDMNCKIAVMQCILNRTQADGFPDTVEAVCTQKNQWEGLTKNSQASPETFRLAKETLREYRNPNGTVLLIPRNCVYFCKTSGGLEFRAKWDISKAEIFYIGYEDYIRK